MILEKSSIVTLQFQGLPHPDDHTKYKILKYHFQPSKTYDFPKTVLHGCKRSCSLEYISNPYFVYSQKEDSVYCIHCALFVPVDKRSGLLSFVNNGYFSWDNIIEKQKKHLKIWIIYATLASDGIVT